MNLYVFNLAQLALNCLGFHPSVSVAALRAGRHHPAVPFIPAHQAEKKDMNVFHVETLAP